MPICSVFAKEFDEVKGPVVLFPRNSRIHSLVVTVICLILSFELCFMLNKGKQWISLPFALLVSWIFNYIRAAFEGTECIRSLKLKFWRFEENSVIKSFLALVCRLLHFCILYGIMFGIDKILNKENYNQKLIDFILCISIIIIIM